MMDWMDSNDAEKIWHKMRIVGNLLTSKKDKKLYIERELPCQPLKS